jgi:type II secretory pathway pseudopilin PulG
MTSSEIKQKGHTYLGLLFIVCLLGLSLTGAALVTKLQLQREKERELLFVGIQYMDAIANYYNSAPGGSKKYPRSIEDLLEDERHLYTKRHLRKFWLDPMTGRRDWNFILTREGGIAGVSSRSISQPLKQTGFGRLESFLEKKSSYMEWRFVYIAALEGSVSGIEYIMSDEDTMIESDNPEPEDDDMLAAETTMQEDETGEELILELGLQKMSQN